ncbi:hypothetical protein K3N28_05820 [Glycomyces sp. TRM65418]|uniref:hypothetical protein n=1 Tax=Glycomyces sp. TRM65418 TaxID=2867006 RepID=UPI001CE6826F|nr:hypothetical protein [Glycomyces sp. TRM65418]MCC3762586.1 hypothetical protein [Glycomyces sp. TRM65418]QZD56625.1 hypothetical protein K3N28_05780 [Glycomyces sp. TRM65418]
MLDADTHQQINAALRQTLANSMPTCRGGIVAVWDLPRRYQVALMDDLAATFVEHRMAGLDIFAAFDALVTELRTDDHTQIEEHLIGLGLIGHAHMGSRGRVASLLALVDGWSHEILWPHAQAMPVWEVKPVADVDDEDCAVYLAALADLFNALTGRAEGGAR